ncbi:MAG: 30S ribosomal protein S1 [Proteobacteria bacterium]|nr:30S ribosomal protein S1 [Pseudomonadota bacterium]
MTGVEDKPQIDELDESEMNFEELFEGSVKNIKEGEVVKGTVVHITKENVVIDIGYKTEGHVSVREFFDEAGVLTVGVGDEVSVLFEKGEDDSGNLVLSKNKADQMKVWDDIVIAAEEDQTIHGTIVQRVKGGFYVDIEGVTAFLPSSQVDLKPVRNPDKLIGTSYDFKVLKYNKRKLNVIVSRRVILEVDREKLRKITLEKLEEGAIVDGMVKNITDYGAFIDLGGIDGLVHLTDLSWGKVTHPTQILNVGDTVSVKILKFNKEEGKISLGMKQTKSDPWETVAKDLTAGSRVNGKVVNITDYGAFVEIEEGLEGLVHISEMSWTKLRHPSQKLKLGDEIEVMILSIDMEQKRISLGLKQVEPNPWDDVEQRHPPGSHVKGPVKNITSFGIFIGVDDSIDGLVHISDLSWKKVKHPSEIFKKGDEVEAVVVKIDKDSRRLSLSTKELEANPWDGVQERYTPGMIIEGSVTSIADFGAFVQLEHGLEGLVHVSELNRGKKKGDEIGVGDKVEVEVLNVDPEENKMGLSIRTVVEKAEIEEVVEEASQDTVEEAVEPAAEECAVAEAEETAEVAEEATEPEAEEAAEVEEEATEPEAEEAAEPAQEDEESS